MSNIVTDVFIPASLAMVTFGIGINITVVQAKEIWMKPKAFLIALSSQMIALPMIAFAISFLIHTTPDIKVGLIVLAASPGGSTSGFLTYMLKGNTALSITLTSINSLLTLFTIPLVVNLGLSTFMGTEQNFHLPFLETVKEIFMVTLIPATLGVLTRMYWGEMASKIAKYIKPVMMVLLGIVFGFMIFGKNGGDHPGLEMKDVPAILPYCLLLNFSCMLVGYLLPGWFKLPYAVRVTTAIESGVHNTTLAFLITFTILKAPELAKPALVYAVMSFWTAILFILATRYFDKKAYKAA